ncbi:MAG TPA: SxtJ family membrane protein [Blastocatellia bacterium]|nr:SxtJ family membrane protein [Blastocatellia bacterium]
MLSYREERNFGLLVGGVFIALGAWWLWRARFQTIALSLITLGAALALFALVFPKALVVPNRLWMGLARLLSLITTPIIMAAIFFLIITPFGLIRRLSGGDPLNRRAARTDSYWKAYSARQSDPRHYEKMY